MKNMITLEGCQITDAKFQEVFQEQVEYCAFTLERKAIEYAEGQADRLLSFKAAAALQNCPTEQALAGMLAKHIVSLYDMCATPRDFPLDIWEEKITDSLNYLFLLKAIVKEGQENG